MDAFVSRKRTRPTYTSEQSGYGTSRDVEEETTDVKLALLASLHSGLPQDVLLESLLSHHGSVENASASLQDIYTRPTTPRKKPQLWTNGSGYQASISSFASTEASLGQSSTSPPGAKRKVLTRKGKTLYLYSPKDIEENTPCSIIHNFLPNDEAEALLREMLGESKTYQKQTFKLFDRVVSSPHTMCFYVDTESEEVQQKKEYIYNGNYFPDVRRTLPEMLKCSVRVRVAVNREIARRIREFYPNGKKLRHQSPQEWIPNTSFVNCYAGGQESLGYHSDQLTYVGPRCIIGSLSLGVAREFRVRKTIAREEKVTTGAKASAHLREDPEGQISIHLPHNSLLVMHAEMQEEWKHAIAPAQSIDPHPLAGNKRINITYRCYKEEFHTRNCPVCKCGKPTVLRCVQRKKETRGKYIWMCYAGYTPGEEGCSFFEWANFDDNGEPPWSKLYKQHQPNHFDLASSQAQPATTA